LAQLIPGAAIEIAADASFKPGDVIFETPQGQLDASVSTQLREIERGLADRVNL
jgi:flagellar biosynthesis/type III secretory pathway protein FliH